MTMELKEIRVDDQITHLALIGTLDVQGMRVVDIKFHGNTAARRTPTLVDLSELEFIASLGMGMFFTCAQALRRHGVKLVLLNPRPMVEEALNAVRMGKAAPIAHDLDEALAILFPPAQT